MFNENQNDILIFLTKFLTNLAKFYYYNEINTKKHESYSTYVEI